ncbi:MAG: hypothetical protein HYX84_08565 [Chloroflexi bacterium]|nr:hypothetical protein [Chloroflexota bacterium]
MRIIAKPKPTRVWAGVSAPPGDKQPSSQVAVIEMAHGRKVSAILSLRKGSLRHTLSRRSHDVSNGRALLSGHPTF